MLQKFYNIHRSVFPISTMESMPGTIHHNQFSRGIYLRSPFRIGKGDNRIVATVDDQDVPVKAAEPDMHDIGILASTDPVALDQACIDLVYTAEDGQSLINRIESRNGLHTLEHAEVIGLGSRAYELVSIDE